MKEIKIGLVGAGVIGKKHALAIKNSTNSKLSAIVDAVSYTHLTLPTKRIV